MKFIVKIFGFVAWLSAVLLTMALVYEFTQGQDEVVTGVAGLAILLSAFGLAFARYSWQKRAYPEVGIGAAMWAAGVVCLTFIEVSYWVNSYEQRFEAYSQEKVSKERHSARQDKEWKALLTGEVPASSAQLAAAIEQKKLDPAIARTANCTDVTREDSRKVCQELFGLQGQLAAARQREELEAKIGANAEPQQKKISSNVFAIAELLARWRGGDVQDWATFVMLWNWLLLTLVRDGGLLVMNPLGRARKPQETAIVSEGPNDKLKELWAAYEAANREKAALKAPRKPMVALEKLSGAKANLQEGLVSSAPTLSKVETMVENHNSEPEPDPADTGAPGPERPMVGLLNQLSEQQKAGVLAFDEPSGPLLGAKPDGEPDPADSAPVGKDDLHGDEIEITEDQVVVTGPWEGKPGRSERAAKIAMEAKKKLVASSKTSEHHKRIRLWSQECGTRLPQVTRKDGSLVEDKDAPYSVDAYSCYRAWHMLHYADEPMHSKLFSRILGGELNLPKVDKRAGAKRDPKARKLWYFRFQYPSEQRKRATA